MSRNCVLMLSQSTKVFQPLELHDYQPSFCAPELTQESLPWESKGSYGTLASLLFPKLKQPFLCTLIKHHLRVPHRLNCSHSTTGLTEQTCLEEPQLISFSYRLNFLQCALTFRPRFLSSLSLTLPHVMVRGPWITGYLWTSAGFLTLCKVPTKGSKAGRNHLDLLWVDLRR